MKSSRLVRTLALAVGLTALAAGPALAQQANVTGRVTDSGSGQPVSTVQVTLAGTTLSTQTNSDGVYTLRGVTPGAVTVRVVRLGYTDQSRQVTLAAGETTTVNFEMEPAPIALPALVTTATGEQRRVEVGNAVAQVNASEVIQTRAVTNVADLLTSRAAGVMVVPGTQTGAGVRVRIRGTSSLSLSNNPIYVVDGIRVEGTTGASSVSVGGT
jgi:hypothetical protein